jgi:hypothetical protein
MDTVLFDSFEFGEFLMKHNSPSPENQLTERQFLDEFEKFLELQILLPGELLLTGDFNFHIDDINDFYAKQFLELIQNFGLVQHIHEATHKDSHTLDLVITKADSIIASNFHVSLPWVSDHSIIQFKLQMKKPAFQRKTISFRQWRSVDIDSFKQDILDTNLMSSSTVSELVSRYNSVMQELADKHAPAKTKTITVKPHAEWYTTELEQQKRKKRKLERVYRKTVSSEDLQAFLLQCAYYYDLILTTRQQFYSGKIEANAGDQKALYGVLNYLLHRQKEQQLPSHDNLYELTSRFADFFMDKIQKIREKIQYMKDDTSVSILENEVCTSAVMSEFQLVTEEDIKKIIAKSPSKFCGLDPVPTWLIKDCLSSLLPVITKIVNLSLSEGVMPQDFKEANLIPLLKDQALDVEILKHFRPISNLAYISKLIEKVVDSQMTIHMKVNNLHDPLQSSYKEFNSTETAMVKLHNDILTALDQNKAVLIVCIDLSAAFDTVDHVILLNRFRKRLGITGTCLAWFTSYLTNRKQSVVIDGVSSVAKDLTCGVPQGSVLGPKLYNAYTLPLGDVIKKHKVDRLSYADDGQMYIAFKASEADPTRERMEHLAADLKNWFIANNLMSNDDKLIAMLINGSRRKPIVFPPLSIGDVEVPLSLSALILGNKIDHTMSMKCQVSHISKKCYGQLHKMYKIRKNITEEAAKTMVHSLVTSRMDYCNALLYGLPDTLLNKLWCVQKTAARLITMSLKYDHMTPVMNRLHWLPIWQRIDFKILVLTFKSLNGQAPGYLTELLEQRTNQGTRRDNQLLLVDPKIKCVTFGGRAFRKAAPVLWNSIPPSIRASDNVTLFKKKIKTHLCHKVYNCSC